jgi:hypothetical protein
MKTLTETNASHFLARQIHEHVKLHLIRQADWPALNPLAHATPEDRPGSGFGFSFQGKRYYLSVEPLSD